MRVISGLAKGRKLISPDGLDTRPTLDRVKESVLSILYPYIDGSNVLDLFGGSGAMGIEALSRGADFCTFVDCNKKAYDCIINNLKNTKLEKNASVRLMTFEKFLSTASEKYDIVFLDPPYNKGMENKAFAELPDIMNDDGVVVLETEYIADEYESFELIRQAKYGRVYITIYKALGKE